MNEKMKLICIFFVLFTFLYSNLVWAGAFPSHKLSPDGEKILEDIFSTNTPSKMAMGLERFFSIQPQNLDRGKLFNQLAEGIASRDVEGLSRGLLDVCRKILFVLFENELKEASINESGASITSAADGKIFMLVGDKEHVLAFEKDKLSIKPQTSPEDPKTAPYGRMGFIELALESMLIVYIPLIAFIICYAMACDARNRSQQTPGSDILNPPPVTSGISSVEEITSQPHLAQAYREGEENRVNDQPNPNTWAGLPSNVIPEFNNWIDRISETRIGLPPSHIGDTSEVAIQHGFASGLFTYDAAQLAIGQLRMGRFELARRIVLYFAERFNEHAVEELMGLKDQNNVFGILRILSSPSDGMYRKHIINCIDTSSAWDDGNGIIEWYTDGGPQSWLGMAAVQLLIFDRDLTNQQRREIETFLIELSETITGLFSSENVVSAGPSLQDIDGSPAREHLGHVENMWDHYAFLIQIADYFESQRTNEDLVRECRNKAETILLGLQGRDGILVRDGNEAYFYQGFQYGNINRQVPTDVQSWGIAAVGPEKLNEVFGEGTAEGMMNWLVGYALVAVDYTRPDGYRVTTIGADFSDPYLPDISGPRQGNDGGRGGRGGVVPMISDEWTGGVIYAMDVMASYYHARGETQKAEEMLAMADALRWFGLQRATEVNGQLYWEYATGHGVPTGYGWNTPSAFWGSLSGNQMLMALVGVNPFDPTGESISVSNIRRLGIERGIELLLERMNSRNRFCNVMHPGDSPVHISESNIPSILARAELDSGNRLLLIDPSILRRISYYSEIGENAGRLRTSEPEEIGVETVSIWNCAEVSFIRYLDLEETPYLTLSLRGSRLRINVVDRAYLEARNWLVAPAYVDVSVPDDGQWHTVTVDLRRAYNANINEVGAISLEVGTDTTGNAIGKQTYIRDPYFNAGEGAGVDNGLIRELQRDEPSPTPQPTDEGQEDTSSSSSAGAGEEICSGRCPQSWGGVVFFRDGSWDLSDDAYFEVNVEGTGEFILRLVGRTQSYDQPAMYSEPFEMGRTHRIYFRDLNGEREYSVKQIGVNVQEAPWGYLPGISRQPEGGTAASINITLYEGGGSRLTPKAWAGNVVPNIGAIGEWLIRNLEVDDRGGDIQPAMRNYITRDGVSLNTYYIVRRKYFEFSLEGKKYLVFNDPDKSYFIIKTPDGEDHIVFGIPFYNNGKPCIIMPRSGYHEINKREYARGQMAAHEAFEAASREERLKMLNMRYEKLERQDKDNFIVLWRKMGFELEFEKEEIQDIMPLTDEAGFNLGHLGGEILEIVDEYLMGKEEGKYEKLTDVLISSLDATYLGLRLNEILGYRVNVDDFIRKITRPGTTQWIVLGLAASTGGIDFEHLERSLEAVNNAREGVTSSNLDYVTKATLVLSEQMEWEDRKNNTLEELLGIGLLREIESGLKANEYGAYESEIKSLLLTIRSEMGEMAQEKGIRARIRISSPYVHGILSCIARMAGINVKKLMEAYYDDLIKTKLGEEGKYEKTKLKLVEAAIENALVESQMVQKQGLDAFRAIAHPALQKNISDLFRRISEDRGGTFGETDKLILAPNGYAYFDAQKPENGNDPGTKKPIVRRTVMGDIRFEGPELEDNVKNAIRYYAGKLTLPQPANIGQTRYILIDEARAEKYEKIIHKISESWNVRFLTEIPMDVAEKDVVVMLDPEDADLWVGKVFKCYLPLIYSEKSFILAAELACTDTGLQDTDAFRFVKEFYERLFGKELNQDEVLTWFRSPWKLKNIISVEDLNYIKIATAQLESAT